MKNQIKKIVFIFFIIVSMIACKKETIKPQDPISEDYTLSIYLDTTCYSYNNSIKFKIFGVNQYNVYYDTIVNVVIGKVANIKINKIRVTDMKINISNKFDEPSRLTSRLTLKLKFDNEVNVFTKSDIFDKYMKVNLDGKKVNPIYASITSVSSKGKEYTEVRDIIYENIFKN
jgi:uncharacterized protein Smg (DUF494 family)